MSPTNKKIIGGALALLFIITLVQSKAISTIAKNVKSDQGVSTPASNPMTFEINDSMMDEVERNQVAQVGGRGGGSACAANVQTSIMPLPSYSLTDGTNTAIVFKFRIANNNTLPDCEVELHDFLFLSLRETNANTNFAKFYLMNANTNTAFNNYPDRLVVGFNMPLMHSVPSTPITLDPGESIDLAIQGEYIRNTNIPEDAGIPPSPDDYFMIGISRINAVVDGVGFPLNIPNRFNKKPIRVQ